MALRWHRKRILAGLPASISHPAKLNLALDRLR